MRRNKVIGMGILMSGIVLFQVVLEVRGVFGIFIVVIFLGLLAQSYIQDG